MPPTDDLPIEFEIPDPIPPPSDAQKAARRKRRIKARLWFYGVLITVVYGVVWYQPYQVDWIPRQVPKLIPPVDPDSKLLFQKGTKVLVVTAHPDDSEFFIGGLLTKLSQSGAELHQVICTDGDKGYYYFLTDAAKNRVVRRSEAQNAASAWNAQTLEFLGYPDRWLPDSRGVVKKIEDAIQRVKPDFILAFDGDFPPRASHTDHRRSGEAAEQAAKEMHIGKWLLLFSTIAPNHIVDITNEWENQKKLLSIHKSQFFGKHLEGVENMVEFSAEKDGERGGFELGEGLRCIPLN